MPSTILKIITTKSSNYFPQILTNAKLVTIVQQMLIVLTKIQIQTVLGTLVLARLASKGTDSTALVFILY